MLFHLFEGMLGARISQQVLTLTTNINASSMSLEVFQESITCTFKSNQELLVSSDLGIAEIHQLGRGSRYDY